MDAKEEMKQDFEKCYDSCKWLFSDFDYNKRTLIEQAMYQIYLYGVAFAASKV